MQNCPCQPVSFFYFFFDIQAEEKAELMSNFDILSKMFQTEEQVKLQ